MKSLSEETILKIIDDLENSNKTYKEIAKENSCSISIIQQINICKTKTNYHSYKSNIRKESQNKNLKIINVIELKEDYGILHIERLDKQTVDTLFSLEDLELIQNNTWTFKVSENDGIRIRATSKPYAGRDLSAILFNEKDKIIDHINRNTLDNRRDNLRAVDHSINSINAKPRAESKTNIRGVYFRDARPGIAKASWICEWSIKGKRHSKSFSIEKYGEARAFELACTLRQEKLKEMKI